MFNEFGSQIWVPSDPSVTVTNDTDTSIDGSCKKLTWANAINEYVDISFTNVNLSTWEEISLYIYLGDQLIDTDMFKITVGGNDYKFKRDEFVKGDWTQIVIDCSSMTNVSNIRITNLIDDLVMLIDYIGYRKVTYNCDIDVIEALKDHIILNYGESTTLSAPASAGDEHLDLVSDKYINDNSMLRLDDGYGTIEDVQLSSKDGDLVSPLVNNFDIGDLVTTICPVLSEDYDKIEPDPVCGIKIYDMSAEKRQNISVELHKDGSKAKEYLGNLGLLIYIDCSSKKKLLQMAREYNRKYGGEFQFLLDGELVDIYLDSSMFTDAIIGNNPRMAYYYQFEPQPYLIGMAVPIDTVNLTMESM